MSGPFYIFFAAILWGLDGILRRSLFTLPPATIVFYEHLIGAIIIAPFMYRVWKQESLSKEEWSAITLVSFLSGAVGTIFFTAALAAIHFIPFSVVFLVQKLQPIFTLATASIFLRERITPHYALWAAIALVAGYFVTFPGGVVNTGEGGGYIIAALYAFAAAVAWGTSTAFSRYTLLNHSHTFITGLRFFITVPIALMFVFALGAAPTLSTISMLQLLTLLAIAVSTGMVALWIYYKGLKTTPASTSAIVELAFPATAVLIDYFLYHTTLYTSQYLAGIVLLFAVYKVATLTRAAPQTIETSST